MIPMKRIHSRAVTMLAAVWLYLRGVVRATRSLTGAEAFYVATRPKFAVRFGALSSIVGAAPTIDELRSAVRSAVDALEQANEAIQSASDDADVEQLRQAFDDAEERHKAATDTLLRAERVAEARDNAPVAVVPEEAEERTGGGGGDARVTSEPMTYERGGENSFFADLFMSRKNSDPQASQRLAKHMEEIRAISTTAGAGGEFVPPVWMNDEFIKLARNGRPLANAVRNLSLPGNTNTINVPSVQTGAATATQADNGSVQSTDPTTGSIAVPVRTVAGQVDTSRQLVDRAIPGIDEILFADLLDDYATKIDVQIISGTGTAPQATGILNTASIQSVSYTDATPTVPELWPKIADAVQRVATLRKKPAEVIVMAPRRWGWLSAALDASNRPLLPASGTGPMNALAVNGAPQGVDVSQDATAPTFVGMLQGLPVLVDPNIPINLGGGTNEDVIIVCRLSDLYLWEEDEPNQATYFEVLSGNLGVRFQVYGYFAFTAARYPSSIATIGGTGLVTPTF